MSPRKTTLLWRIVAVVLLVGLLGFAVAYLLYGRHWQARHDVRVLRRSLEFYLAEQGAYPEGSLAEIASLLLGQSVCDQNPSRKSYIVARPDEMNGAGEFVDPWSAPYCIVVDGVPRVYSCGPNRQDENGGGDDIRQ
ncbi:hypothetical protein HQ590_12630 [bacterium]|nr:hypothetical protein [bacterium]